MRLHVVWVACCQLAACQEGPLTWERMITQRRVDPYQQTDYFSDDRAVRPLPAGTMPVRDAREPEIVRRGEEGGVLAAVIPLPASPAMLADGHRRFNIHCAPCHGQRGDGQSVVAQFMTIKRPTSLSIPPVSEYPPGKIFQRISQGYRYMRSYQEIELHDRWAIVLHVESLRAAAPRAQADARHGRVTDGGGGSLGGSDADAHGAAPRPARRDDGGEQTSAPPAEPSRGSQGGVGP